MYLMCINLFFFLLLSTMRSSTYFVSPLLGVNQNHFTDDRCVIISTVNLIGLFGAQSRAL